MGALRRLAGALLVALCAVVASGAFPRGDRRVGDHAPDHAIFAIRSARLGAGAGADRDPPPPGEVVIIRDVLGLASGPGSDAGAGVRVLGVEGPRRHAPFALPPPHVLDEHVLADFAASFNRMQDMACDGSATAFDDGASDYVAAIPHAFVEGVGGLVSDGQGRVYHERNFFFERAQQAGQQGPLPLPRGPGDTRPRRHYRALATLVQKYGHMYYHWIVETLPKLVLLRDSGALASYPDLKILSWGEPYEGQYLEMLGIEPSILQRYDPDILYSADTLLFPTPTARITPAREGLLAVRDALGVSSPLPREERDLIIYCSRDSEASRRVANEADILSAIRARWPDEKLVIYRRGPPAGEVISLFQKAKVILGPHGAGLSHTLFAAPGTAVVEFIFMRDPPMMFWHTAAALNQTYWMIPVPQAHWMQPEMAVPPEDVLGVLGELLGAGAGAVPCDRGSQMVDGDCALCPPGTYGAGGRCQPCYSGRYSPSWGAAACRTCPAGTWAVEGISCTPCPEGTTTLLPGASSALECKAAHEHAAAELQSTTSAIDTLAKLSPNTARVVRRAVLEGEYAGSAYGAYPGEGAAQNGGGLQKSAPATEAELARQAACALQQLQQQGDTGDPYTVPPADCVPREDGGGSGAPEGEAPGPATTPAATPAPASAPPRPAVIPAPASAPEGGLVETPDAPSAGDVGVTEPQEQEQPGAEPPSSRPDMQQGAPATSSPAASSSTAPVAPQGGPESSPAVTAETTTTQATVPPPPSSPPPPPPAKSPAAPGGSPGALSLAGAVGVMVILGALF